MQPHLQASPASVRQALRTGDLVFPIWPRRTVIASEAGRMVGQEEGEPALGLRRPCLTPTDRSGRRGSASGHREREVEGRAQGGRCEV